jgi:hypothetical protein
VEVEHVVLNALSNSFGLPPDFLTETVPATPVWAIFAIVFRHGESLIGEADPPLR